MSQASRPKRMASRIAQALLVASALLAALGIAVLAALPLIVEAGLRSRLKELPGIERISVGVRRADPFGIDVGPIAVGGSGGNAIEADAVRIDFTPGGLLRGRVQRILVSGLDIRIRVEDGSVVLPGVDFQRLLEGAPSDAEAPALSSMPPSGIPVGPVVVPNATIDVASPGFRRTIPLSLTAVPESGSGSRWIFDGRIRPQGRELAASGSIDWNDGFCRLRFEANHFRLGRLSHWMRIGHRAELKGRIDLAGSAVIALRPVSLQSFTAVAEGRGVSIASGAWRVHSGKAEPPLRFELYGQQGRSWNLYGSRLVVDTPYSAFLLEDLVLPFTTADGAAEGSGSVLLRVEPIPPESNSGIFLTEPFRMPLHFTGRLALPGHWQFDLAAEPESAASVALRADPVGGRCRLKKISVSVHGQERNLSATLSAVLESIRADAAQTAIQIPRAALIGGFDIAGASPPGSSWSDFTLRLIRPSIENPSATLTAEHLTVTGEIDGLFPEKAPQLRAKIQLERGRATVPEARVTASGIGLSLPVQWPISDHGVSGRLTVSQLRRDHHELGDLVLDLYQKTDRLQFSGEHHSHTLPGLVLRLEGSTGRTPEGSWDAALQAEAAPAPYGLDIDLGRFSPAASGLRLTGDLKASGHFFVGRRGVQGSAEARLNDGSLASKDNGLHVEGLQASLRFPELPILRTGPQQELSFQSVQAGNFLFTEGTAAFQIESPDSLFLERASFDWCGGRVDTHALRLSPAAEDFRVVLYCDRLVLSRILEQIGTVRAEGEGTVNGKIPLRFRDGSITFSDGFLYSTPGKGGTIRLTGTEILTAGIPRSSPQFHQLDLASEALKDYSYQWARLGMNSEGETLILRLQMDGKPARPLPFVYRRDIGGFVRVEAGSEGSEFQGIRLDVNFKLPLDQILRYQDVLRGLQ